MLRFAELLRGGGVIVQDLLEQRHAAPVVFEVVPLLFLGRLKRARNDKLQQVLLLLEGLMTKVDQGVWLGFALAPGLACAAIRALKTALCLVGVHGTAAALAFDGEYLFHCCLLNRNVVA